MARDGLTNQRVSVVAETYARALFELASEAGTAEVVRDQLLEIARLVDENDDLAALLAHRLLDPARRAASLRNLFEGQVEDVLMRFLLVLNDKRRLEEIPGIAVSFDKRLKESRGEVDVQVITARPLSDEQLAGVRDQISSAIGKTAIVHETRDESLIGGLKIRIGDKLIDASVARQLRSLAHDLIEKSHSLASEVRA